MGPAVSQMVSWVWRKRAKQFWLTQHKNECGMETKSHWEPVGLCLITHWTLINRKKGPSSVSNGLMTAIGIGFGSGLKEDRQTFLPSLDKNKFGMEQKDIGILLDCV
jgi:hypothetical protein